MMNNAFGRCEVPQKDYDPTEVIRAIEDGNRGKREKTEREEICGGSAKENCLNIAPEIFY